MKTLEFIYLLIALFSHLLSYAELFNMKISPYVYTINKNDSFRLDPDELKDVVQEINISLYRTQLKNDFLIKKEIMKHYQRAIERKKRNEHLVANEAYLDNFNNIGIHEVEVERKDKIPLLNLTKIQRKIVELLVSGFDYSEIRKRLKINSKQLINHIYQIKVQNCTG